MGIGVEKDSGNAVNRYCNEDFYFCSAAISSAVVSAPDMITML